MKTQTNDVMFQQPAEPPRVVKPERCNAECIHFHFCRFPATCPVLIKTRQAEKEGR